MMIKRTTVKKTKPAVAAAIRAEEAQARKNSIKSWKKASRHHSANKTRDKK